MARLLKRSHVEAVSTSTDVPASLTSRLSPLASRLSPLASHLSPLASRRSLALVPAGTLQGLDHLSKSDARLLRSIERLTDQQIDAMSGRPRVTAFTSLCKSITSQQVSTAAARTIFGRFQGVAPAPTDNDDDTGDNVCPHAVHECSHETLRGAGLSNAKTRAVKDLAARFVDGSLTEKALSEAASINELEELLLDVRGIGPWTVQMFAIFFVRFADIEVTGDLGVQKGCAKIYALRSTPTRLKMESIAKTWTPYRSLGAMLCWKALDET